MLAMLFAYLKRLARRSVSPSRLTFLALAYEVMRFESHELI